MLEPRQNPQLSCYIVALDLTGTTNKVATNYMDKMKYCSFSGTLGGQDKCSKFNARK